MNNTFKVLIIVLFFYSCSTNKSAVINDKDKKIQGKTIDFYKESNEEAYEQIIRENEKKQAVLNNSKKPISNSTNEIEEEILVATSKVKVTKEVVLQYINKYRAVAIDNMNNYNIPASITLAQGILESGCGTSKLSVEANNHFGIKCHSTWEGESVTHSDDAPNECFRKYKNARDSYRDHSIFLTTRKWYEPLFELDIKDYKAWSYGLKKSGYATDPNYPKKLITIIERYNLNEYDNYYSINIENSKKDITTTNEIESKPMETDVKPEMVEVKPEIVEEKKETIGSKSITNAVEPEKIVEDVKKESSTENTNTKNTKKHTVVKGDTLYNISKRYNITVEKLRTLNNISESNISLGQELIVE